ncbi:hypothetical protein C8Q74DRAFT_1226973 [Fomes fomentarius]|nr:hypothetical protein C8Q74DRAFT_1226973 [Fomes fomentarius]
MPPRRRGSAQISGNDVGGQVESVVGTSITAHDNTVRRNLRGRRGGLRDMPNMPLDVLIEIFTVMHPRDLLNLARTSKPFRALLMSRSAKPFWKASIAGIEGLPKCPPYLSEPAFVNLLFFSHCHNCLKPNVKTVQFQFSARYCQACKSKMYLPWREYQDLLGETETWASTERTSNLFPTVWEPTVSIHKPDVEAFKSRWVALGDVADKKALMEEYTQRVRQIEVATKEFDAWKDAQKVKRSAELSNIRRERVEAIKDRLLEAGWADELTRMSYIDLRIFANEKFASKAEVLTERGWQKIQTDVLSFMEGIKERRLTAERKVVLQGHFQLFAKAYDVYRNNTKRDYYSDGDPHLLDFVAMTEFRDILDVPQGTDLSILDNADEMRKKFDAVIAKWREDHKNELALMVRKSLQVPEDVRDPLELARALFHCTTCDRMDLMYPAVAAHRCLRMSSPGLLDDYVAAARSLWYPDSLLRSPWSMECLRVSETAIAHIQTILEACGLDQERATVRDAVGECKARLICTGCHGGGSASSRYSGPGGKVSRWKWHTVHDRDTALYHALVLEPHNTHNWECISEKEWEVVRPVEKELEISPWLIDWDKYVHGCDYCEYSALLPRMEGHLKQRHGIEVDEDTNPAQLHCYSHPDARIRLPDVVLDRYDDGRVTARYFRSLWRA